MVFTPVSRACTWGSWSLQQTQTELSSACPRRAWGHLQPDKNPAWVRSWMPGGSNALRNSTNPCPCFSPRAWRPHSPRGPVGPQSSPGQGTAGMGPGIQTWRGTRLGLDSGLGQQGRLWGQGSCTHPEVMGHSSGWAGTTPQLPLGGGEGAVKASNPPSPGIRGEKAKRDLKRLIPSHSPGLERLRSLLLLLLQGVPGWG